ncbi:MAG TPA: HAD family hydrolase [Methylomirabilota bacterium]|nr:HAD family hydrolase [Methylomirabilota bacterium]
MKGLILLDWDATVVNGDDEISYPPLQEIIEARIDQGWYVGLNSDTPLNRLRGWWESLRLNGPIVAEKGALIWWPGEKELVLSQTRSIFSAFREKMILALTKIEGVALFYGDSTHFIRSVRRVACNDEILVALDAYRLCSLGMFVRLIREGNLICDPSATEKMYAFLKSVSPSHALISPIDFSQRQGFLKINALDTNKTTGVRVLLENWTKAEEVIMIGDSMNDYLDLPNVHHWAVGNAEPEFRMVAEKVAIESYSQGCIELLSSL